jgi:hypothetical protein
MKAPAPNPYVPRVAYEKPPLVGGFSSHSEKIACAEYLAEKFFLDQTGFVLKINFDGKAAYDINLRRAFFYAARTFGVPAGVLARKYKTTYTSIYSYVKHFQKTSNFLEFRSIILNHILNYGRK